MAISRIYQAVPLQVGAILRLDDKASHHLGRVLRAVAGDTVTLFNGEGGEYLTRIVRIDRKGIDVCIQTFIEREVESPIQLYLAQGIARGEKMDFIIQKAVELGVTKIFPLNSERSHVRLDKEREQKRLLHWQAIVVSACEQSGRNRLPIVMPPLSVTAYLQTIQTTHCFVLSPHVKPSLQPINASLGDTVALLIGPEGGLSDAEVALAEQHGYQPLRLGPRVLRTETATVAALAIIQAQLGDMS